MLEKVLQVFSSADCTSVLTHLGASIPGEGARSAGPGHLL